jgi:hypothetical protein
VFSSNAAVDAVYPDGRPKIDLKGWVVYSPPRPHPYSPIGQGRRVYAVPEHRQVVGKSLNFAALGPRATYHSLVRVAAPPWASVQRVSVLIPPQRYVESIAIGSAKRI